MFVAIAAFLTSPKVRLFAMDIEGDPVRCTQRASSELTDNIPQFDGPIPDIHPPSWSKRLCLSAYHSVFCREPEQRTADVG